LHALPPARTQVMKIAVAPTVIALELLMFRRVPPMRIVMSVMVVCAGIGVATVTDTQVRRRGACSASITRLHGSVAAAVASTRRAYCPQHAPDMLLRS
jgi:hypothetical protein